MITRRCLANGFIITSMLWAAALAALLDSRYRGAATYLLIAGGMALVGIIHSPLPAAPIDWPWNVWEQLQDSGQEAAFWQTPYHWAASYGLAAGALWGLSWWSSGDEKPESERP
jgi:hypothetical protein